MLLERLHCMPPAGQKAAGNDRVALCAVVIVTSMMMKAGNTSAYYRYPYGNFQVEMKAAGEQPLFHVKVWKRNPETRRLKLVLDTDFSLDQPLAEDEMTEAFAELDEERQRKKNAGRN